MTSAHAEAVRNIKIVVELRKMIDLKKEAAKFKEIVLEENITEEVKNENGEVVDTVVVEKAPEYDNDTKNAVAFYNKAIEQVGNNLDDMAKANLRKSIQLRPDFPNAVSLLAAIMLSKGDRNGVLRLMTNTDINIKKIIQPYIDYLFSEFDRVEYTRERKADKEDPFSKKFNANPVVYVNNEGRKEAKPFEENKEQKKITYTSGSGMGSGWAQAPFEIGSSTQPGKRRSAFDDNVNGQSEYGQREYGQSEYGQSEYRQSEYGQREYSQKEYGQREYSQKEYGQSGEKSNDFNYTDSSVKKTYATKREGNPEFTGRQYEIRKNYNDKVNSNSADVDSLMGGNIGRNNRNIKNDDDEVEIKKSDNFSGSESNRNNERNYGRNFERNYERTYENNSEDNYKDNSEDNYSEREETEKKEKPYEKKVYTKQEIKKNRIIALAFIALILLVVFLVIFILDANKKEKREAEEISIAYETISCENENEKEIFNF